MNGKLVGLGILLIVIGGPLFYYFMLTENTEFVPLTTWGPRDWIYESLTVPPDEYVYRWAVLPNASTVTVEFNSTRGETVDFLVLDEQDYLSWQNGTDVSNPFHRVEDVDYAKIVFRIPYEGTWVFIWNNVSPSEFREVTANVTWTGQVIEYTEVSKPRSLDEQMYGAIGAVILIVGIIVVVFGLTGLFTSYKSARSEAGESKSLSIASIALKILLPSSLSFGLQ